MPPKPHAYTKAIIPPTETYLEQKCQGCGLIRRVFRGNNMLYHHGSNNAGTQVFKSELPSGGCTGKRVMVIKEMHITEISITPRGYEVGSVIKDFEFVNPNEPYQFAKPDQDDNPVPVERKFSKRAVFSNKQISNNTIQKEIDKKEDPAPLHTKKRVGRYSNNFQPKDRGYKVVISTEHVKYDKEITTMKDVENLKTAMAVIIKYATQSLKNKTQP